MASSVWMQLCVSLKMRWRRSNSLRPSFKAKAGTKSIYSRPAILIRSTLTALPIVGALGFALSQDIRATAPERQSIDAPAK